MGNVQNKTKQQKVFSISRIFLENRISKIETFFDPASISKKIHELKLEGRKLIVHVFPVFGTTVNAVVYMEKNTSFHSPSARTLYETIIISKVFPDTKLPKKMVKTLRINYAPPQAEISSCKCNPVNDFSMTGTVKVSGGTFFYKMYLTEPHENIETALNNSLHVEEFIVSRLITKIRHFTPHVTAPTMLLVYKKVQPEVPMEKVKFENLILNKNAHIALSSAFSMKERASCLRVTCFKDLIARSYIPIAQVMVSLTKDSLLEILMQMAYTLIIFEDYGLSHNDLHLGNVFLLSAPSQGEVRYDVRGKTFVLSGDSMIKIIDFDRGSKSETILDQRILKNTILGQETDLCAVHGFCNSFTKNLDWIKFISHLYLSAENTSVKGVLEDLIPHDWRKKLEDHHHKKSSQCKGGISDGAIPCILSDCNHCTIDQTIMRSLQSPFNFISNQCKNFQQMKKDTPRYCRATS